MHDLAALAIGATGEIAKIAAGRGIRAARLVAIKADIAANFGSNHLSIDLVATRHGITPRYVRKLFENEGTSFSDFVRGRRLSQAYRMLTDRRHFGRTISAIAFDCGFSDLSYFNRTFRRRYGSTPSDVREMARRAANRFQATMRAMPAADIKRRSRSNLSCPSRATKDRSRGAFLSLEGLSACPRTSPGKSEMSRTSTRLLLGIGLAGLIMESTVIQPAFAADKVSLFKVITAKDEIVIGMTDDELAQTRRQQRRRDRQDAGRQGLDERVAICGAQSADRRPRTGAAAPGRADR